MRKKLISALLSMALLLSLGASAFAAYVPMDYSERCVEIRKESEGFRSMPYSDGTGYYIGYGTSCNPSDYPDGITQEEAEEMLRSYLQKFADDLNEFLAEYNIGLTQPQFDALCLLSYNLGAEWLDKDYTLPSILIDGIKNYSEAEIASAFAVWSHIGTSVSEGLVALRLQEAKMFLYGDYGDGGSPDFCYLVLDPNGGKVTNDIYCYEKGGSYGTLPEAVRDGSVFKGWQTASGSVLSPDDLAMDNLYVTALWDTGTGVQTSQTDVTASAFPDVTSADWFYTYVTELAGRGVINGYDDGMFHPSNTLTYAEALKLILLASGYAEQTNETAGEHWANAYLDYAVKKGFVSEGQVTNLDASITRYEIADIAAKALEITSSGAASVFADTSSTSVMALYEAAIVEGSLDTGSRTYNGNADIKRSEISAIISRIAKYVDENLILFAGNRLRIDDTLRRYAHDTSLISWQGSRAVYTGNIQTLTGIDVSYYQKDIDWNAVASDGIDFAFIRAGYRGYSEGSLNEDENFKKNIAGSINAGISTGVYFFSQAITEAEAREEAQYVLSLISGYNFTWPVVFDWEPISDSSARTNNLDGATLTKCAIAFCEVIEAAGYTPMVYFNKSVGYLKYDLRQIQNYEIWFAQYVQDPDFLYDYQIWQYGAGSVNGIPGDCDLNIAFRNYG